MADQGGVPDGKHWCQLEVRFPGSWRDGDVQDCRRCYQPPDGPVEIKGKRQKALDRIAELEAALYAIMRVTDPGDLRSVEARQAWETANPPRRIAREALGLPIGGTGVMVATGEQLDAERRGDVYDPCRGCVHAAHELTCLAVIDPPRAQRCGCRTRKSESLTDV